MTLMRKERTKYCHVRLRTVIGGCVSAVVLLVAWEALARAQVIPMSIFPPPSRVAVALLRSVQTGELFRDLGASLWRAYLGLLLGAGAGILLGVGTGRLHWVDILVSPVLNVFRQLPPVALIPLFVVWFGIGDVSKLAAIATAVAMPVWINTHAGCSGIERDHYWTARSLCLTNSQMLFRIILPLALPSILVGVRVGIATAFIMVFVSELAGASSGLGYQISVSQLSYRIDKMIAALLMLGLCGAISDVLFVGFSRRVFPWTARWKRASS